MTVYTLTLGALQTNCYIVSDGTLAAVIDPADDAAAIVRALNAHRLTLGAVMLTHAHFDHMGAVAALMKDTDVPLYCLQEEKQALTDGQRNLSALFGGPLDTVDTTRAVFLKDGDTVTVGELHFAVLHTPGHTVGSGCFLLEDHLFAGDTLFFESIGRTDFPGGDLRAMRDSLRRLATLDGDVRVYPGHGDATTIAHERHYNIFMR